MQNYNKEIGGSKTVCLLVMIVFKKQRKAVINMHINKPKTEDISLANVKWGSKEFDELIKKAKKQNAEQAEYRRTIEAIRTIQGD